MAPNLDLKQLQEIGRQVIKAAEGGDPPATLLSLLQPLEKFTATEELLRHSRIGIAINQLRAKKDADPKVALLASQLINKWKGQVKRKPGSPSLAAAKAGGAVNGRSGTSSPAPGKPAAAAAPAPAPKKFNVDPDKRNSKTDKVDTAVTGNASRDGCVKLMYDGLAFMSEDSPEDIMNVAKQVELSAFNAYQPETSKPYKEQMRKLFMNLKQKSNVQLRKGVLSGAIAPERFVKMSSDELKSEEKRKSDAVLEEENMKSAMTAQEEKAISTTMQCGKCRQYKVAYSQAQTRSADEPMTTFCECTNCGHRWKFS